MNISKKFIVSSALCYLAYGGSIESSTVDEGYSATYSEAGEWSYVPEPDYNSNRKTKDYSNYGSYYEYSHTTYDYNTRSSNHHHKSSNQELTKDDFLATICAGLILFCVACICNYIEK